MITKGQRTSAGQSVNVALYLDNIPLGGQQGATLSRQAQVIDITSKIDGEWGRNLTGQKNWSVVCSGLYIVNDKSFTLLNNAFMNNTPVKVTIAIGDEKLVGTALIVDFPLSAVFNKEFKYNLRLLGTGPLSADDNI